MRLAPVALIALAGCSATVVDEAGEVDVTTTGALAVERLVSFDPDESPRSRVSARFLRVRGQMDPDDASRLVGTASDSGIAAPLVPGCAPVQAPAAVDVSAPARVELLDVGEVVLLHDDVPRDSTPDALRLAARAFPDVGDLVSGVVYTSRDDSVDVPVGGRYLVATSGSPWLDAFSASVEAPEALAGLQIGGRDVDEPLTAELALELGAPLALRWDAGTPADVIYLDVRPADGGATMRCVFGDVGEAEVPAAILGASAGAIELSLHRHRRAELAAALAAGLEEASIEFDFAVTLGATLVEP